jgi:hypothetical protein
LKEKLWMEQPTHNAVSYKFKFSFRNAELLMPADHDRADAAGRKTPAQSFERGKGQLYRHGDEGKRQLSWPPWRP